MFHRVHRFLNKVSQLLIITMLGGCAYLVVGGLGAVGGYVVSPDTVEGIISGREYDEVWEATVEVISIMGIIQERSDQGGVLIAKVQGTKLTITAFRLSQSAIKLTIKARKAFFPRIKSAQDVYIKIISYMEE